MTSYRRKNELMSPLPEVRDDYMSSSSAVFASAIATSQTQKSAQRRVRGGSTDPYGNGGGGGGTISVTSISDWSNGWKEEPTEEEDLNVWEAEASSSTSSSGRPPRPSTRTLLNGLTSSPSHPLSSPSPSGSWRRSHDEPRASNRNRSTRQSWRRTNSDGPDESKDGVSLWSDTRKGKGRMVEDETEVIVHEILPSDSLAGVALRYGVELSDLRKANKLWASDTIHLRKTLLIPLDSRKFKSSTIDALIALEEESEATAPATSQGEGHDRIPKLDFHSPPRTKPASADPDESSGPNSLRETATIKRVPVSQLSFFPPSTSTSSAGTGLRAFGPTSSRRNSSSGGTLNNALPPFSNLTLQPHYLSPPPGINMNAITSSLRGIPSLFVARHNPLGSPRLSVSSEGGTSETSEAPELELEDALDWIPRTGKRGTKKSTGRRSKIQDIDWTIMDPSNTADTLFHSTPKLLEPIRLIQTQQPGPTPRMELPGGLKPP
ncbi:hypothetical protein FRB94_002335 [Tulasnella sp. JGI-2019a]|nr:hypothetical protein FRB94_002335 [Tulasnella sp. JGI-2019a]KAG9035244.1 hypothetical protein FRB95_011687 [Tulasnella sp. JGI-2019a]